MFENYAPQNPLEGFINLYGSNGLAKLKISDSGDTKIVFKLREEDSFAGISFVWRKINHDFLKCYGLDTRNYNQLNIVYYHYNKKEFTPMIKVKDATMFTMESKRRYLSEQSCNNEHNLCRYSLKLEELENEGLNISCLEGISIGVDAEKSLVGKNLTLRVHKLYFE